MDYEQKYNELVEAIKVLQEANPSDEGIQNWVKDNVPELRESEDEKIRKEIIDIFQCKTRFTSEDDSKKYVAWLEKLKVFTEHGDGLYYFANSEFTYIDNPTWDNGSFLEKQGRKPAEWKQENREELTEFENAMMHIGGSFFGENAGLDPNDTDTIKEQAELLLELAPKTEWSEEDEGFLNLLLSIFTNEHPNGIFTTGNITVFKGNCVTSNNIITWIKSIKDRVQLKSKWGEEDDSMFQSCIGAVATNDYYKGEEKEQIYDWLKSLKQKLK